MTGPVDCRAERDRFVPRHWRPSWRRGKERSIWAPAHQQWGCKRALQSLLRRLLHSISRFDRGRLIRGAAAGWRGLSVVGIGAAQVQLRSLSRLRVGESRGSKNTPPLVTRLRPRRSLLRSDSTTHWSRSLSMSVRLVGGRRHGALGDRLGSWTIACARSRDKPWFGWGVRLAWLKPQTSNVAQQTRSAESCR